MRNIQINESAAVVLAVGTLLLIQYTFIINYAPYLLAFAIIIFSLFIWIKNKSKSASQLFTGTPLEIYAISFVILLIVVLTNGLSSPLFFFLYFILFLLAFISKPLTIWTFLLSVVLFFMPTIASFTFDAYLKIASLILITPIAFFVAREFEKRQQLNSRIEAKADDIIQEAEVLKENTDPSAVEENEAINEIIEEAESLKKDSEI